MAMNSKSRGQESSHDIGWDSVWQLVENLWNERVAEATSTDTAVTSDIFVTAEPEARSRSCAHLFVRFVDNAMFES